MIARPDPESLFHRRSNNLFARLLREKNSVNVGKDTSRSNGNTSKQLVQLLVVLHGKGDMTGHNTSLLVVAGGIAGKLEDLSAEVLEDGGEVDGSTGTHAGGVLALTEVTADTTDGELKSSLGRRGGALLLAAASFSFSRHDELIRVVMKLIANAAVDFLWEM